MLILINDYYVTIVPLVMKNKKKNISFFLFVTKKTNVN